jgi:hypothetical protein
VSPLVWSHSTYVDVVNKYRRAVEGVTPATHGGVGDPNGAEVD